MNKVLAILMNYRRTKNTLKIAEVMAKQPCDVVIVDNGPGTSLSASGRIPMGVKDVWRWRVNSGPACWFAPALDRHHEYDYILGIDDDLLPGADCVQYLLDCADVLNNEFSVIGQIGRRVRSRRGQFSYKKRNVRRGPEPTPVDIVCRAYFFRASLAGHIALARSQMMAQGARKELYRHDDVLLSLALEKSTGWPSYLIPACPPSAQLIAQELPDAVSSGVSVSANPGHVQERTELIQLFAGLGWTPGR